jgi:hypothetical protein
MESRKKGHPQIEQLKTLGRAHVLPNQVRWNPVPLDHDLPNLGPRGWTRCKVVSPGKADGHGRIGCVVAAGRAELERELKEYPDGCARGCKWEAEACGRVGVGVAWRVCSAKAGM